jgi:hypothetical protein
MGETSGTGVLFTRNPSTGENILYGEYLMNAQGEDVVAGIRTPNPISHLQDQLPDAYGELLKNIEILEKYYHDMQDIEFTIQEGRLFMLQTRTGKRVGNAAVNIAMDLVKDGICTTDEAIMTVKPEHLNQLLHAQFVNIKDKLYTDNVVAKGLPASPGTHLSLAHSLTHLLTYSLAYSLTHSLTHSLAYSLTCLLTYSLTYLLTHSITHSLTHSLTYSLTCLLIHSLTHSRRRRWYDCLLS